MFKKKLKLLLLVIGSLILSAIMPIVIFANSSTEPSELKWTSETTVEWKAPSEKPGNQQLLRYQIRIYRNGNIVAGGEGNEIYTRINKYTISESIMSVPGNYRLEVRAQGGYIVGDPDSPTAQTYWGEYGNWVGIDSPSASHTHIYGEEWKKDKVQHWKECDCGEKTEVANHKFGEWEITKPATEQEEGTREKSCETCGYKETEKIEKLEHTHVYGEEWKKDKVQHWKECGCGEKTEVANHKFGEWEITKPATEQEEGTREKSCEICGYKETEKIEKLEHTHVYGEEWKKDKVQHWKECGCGEKTEIANHRFGEWEITKQATEQEEGIREKSCEICGYKETEKIEKLEHTHVYGEEWKKDKVQHWKECGCGEKTEIANHRFGEWEITKQATEQEEGIREKSCETCGYKETEKIEKLEHTHVYGEEWKKDKVQHWKECGCGEKTEIANHRFGEWEITKQATEQEEGTREKSCETCGYKETEKIEKLEHTHVYGEEWKKDKVQHWKECGCGEKTEIANHRFGEWKITKQATEQEEGIREKSCETCGYKETEKIEKLGHTHVYGEEWKKDKVQHWKECGCGEKTEIANHRFGEWEITKQATEQEEGIREKSCETCGYKETEKIEKLGHTHVYGEEWKKDKVQHWKECECGVKSDEAEHTKKVINEKVATTTEDGYTGDTVCEICGYEISKGKVVPMIKEEQKPQGDNKPQEQQKPQEDNKPQEQDKTENNTPQQQENSNKKEDNSTNPQTGDNVLTFGIIFAIATLGLASTIISKKKLKK